jgi:hypothetical protein
VVVEVLQTLLVEMVALVAVGVEVMELTFTLVALELQDKEILVAED